MTIWQLPKWKTNAIWLGKHVSNCLAHIWHSDCTHSHVARRRLFRFSGFSDDFSTPGACLLFFGVHSLPTELFNASKHFGKMLDPKLRGKPTNWLETSYFPSSSFLFHFLAKAFGKEHKDFWSQGGSINLPGNVKLFSGNCSLAPVFCNVAWNFNVTLNKLCWW